MPLTLIEQDILDRFPKPWVQQAQQIDVIHARGMGIQWDVPDWVDSRLEWAPLEYVPLDWDV